MTVLIEGILILVISLMVLAEGARLILYKDPYVRYDPLGPGFYVFVIGISLTTLGILHLTINYRKTLPRDKAEVESGVSVKVISIVSVFAIYILLVGVIGYSAASLVFFLLIFRVVGIKSWRTNIIFTIAFTAFCYFIFVYYGNVIFPRGVFLR